MLTSWTARRPLRPPRLSSCSELSVLLPLLLILAFAAGDSLALAATMTVIDPSTTTFNLTAGSTASFFVAPASSAATANPVQVMLSVCSPPSTWTNVPADLATTPVLFVSNDSAVTSSPGPSDGIDKATLLPLMRSNYGTSPFVGGFANRSMLSTTTGGGLFIGVSAPADSLSSSPDPSGNGSQWTFSLSVTSSNSGSDLVVLDLRAGYRVEDTDSSSALLTTRNYSVSLVAPSFTSTIARTSKITAAFARSLCFVQTGVSGVVSPRHVNQITTNRGAGDGVKTQYYLQGLRSGVNYTSWLLETLPDRSTRLYQPSYFLTQTSSSCQLIFDIPLCPLVAYSVPAPIGTSASSLISFYSTNISSYLAAFNRTLSTFPCSSPLGRYSSVSTCGDCYAAYTNWVCAVSFPRCTDAASNASILASNLFSDQWVLPNSEPGDSYSTTLLRDNPPASRTPLLAPASLPDAFPDLEFNATYTASQATPFPYSEVPPCLSSVCELVGARCPPVIGWTCPRAAGGMGRSAYGELRQIASEDRQWGSVQEVSETSWSSWDSDRFGHTFCNSLGSDQELAKQFVPHTDDGE